LSKLYNLARVETTTTGSGTMTLGDAVIGCLTFANAGVQDGEVVSYTILDSNNTESGHGTYSSTGPTLARTTIYSSTNSGSVISLSGNAQVAITALAQDIHDNTTAAYASRPAAGNDGDLFLPSNGLALYRDTGAAWVPWGPIFPLTKANLSDFAWLNQETATAVEANGSICIIAPANDGGDLRILKKSAPATPYVVTALLWPLLMNTNYGSVGLCFIQSSDSKVQILSTSEAGNIQVSKYSNTSTFSASYGAYTPNILSNSRGLWFRIADDGTNRICSISADGINFTQLHTVSRTDYLTADEIGFFAESANTTYQAINVLLSWKVT